MKRLLKIVIPVILFIFLLSTAYKDYHAVIENIHTIKLLPLILCFILLLTVYPEGAYAWYKIVVKLGGNDSIIKALYVWIVSNTSRYIPGTIWQYVGRIELSRKELALKRSVAVTSVYTEVLFSLIAAGIVSLLAFPVLIEQNSGALYLLLLTPLIFVFLHPKTIQFFLILVSKFMKRDQIQIIVLNARQVLSILPWFILNYILNGSAILLLLYSFGEGLSISKSLIVVGFYAFSWVVGYVSVIAPGGIGVTDLSLSYLLSLYMPLSLGVTITLLYRLLLTISELAVFLVTLKLNHGQKTLLGKSK